MPKLFALFALFGAFACSSEPVMPVAERRVLVIGWDGATFRSIDPLVAAGRLPNVKALLARGVSARLESTIIPISSAAWTGAVTGKHPGQTGVYSFFSPIANDTDVELVSSKSVKAAPIWRILSGHGLRSTIFGVPITYPPELMDGVLVGGMLSPFDAPYTHPPEYADELRATGFVPDLGIWRNHEPSSIKRFEEQLNLKRDAVLKLLAREDWSLSWIVFKSLDVMKHRTYRGGTAEPVATQYERLDAVLGEILQQVGDDTEVMLISDHGFTTYDMRFNLHEWMLREGFSIPRADSSSSGPASGSDLASRRASEHKRRIESLDLAKSKGFAAACEGHFGSIRLNLADRDFEESESTTKEALSEIEERLRALVDPVSKQAIVTRIHRASELYPGPHLERLPDLLFEVDPRYLVSSAQAGQIFSRSRAPRPDHDRYGIFIGAGPSFTHSEARGEHRIFDIAPTALHLLGLPVYEEMTGEVALFDGEMTRIAEADDALFIAARPAEAESFDSKERDEIRERLKALSYTE